MKSYISHDNRSDNNAFTSASLHFHFPCGPLSCCMMFWDNERRNTSEPSLWTHSASTSPTQTQRYSTTCHPTYTKLPSLTWWSFAIVKWLRTSWNTHVSPDILQQLSAAIQTRRKRKTHASKRAPQIRQLLGVTVRQRVRRDVMPSFDSHGLTPP